MVYQAQELLLKLTHLTLAGQNYFGELEFIGTNEQWAKATLANLNETN